MHYRTKIAAAGAGPAPAQSLRRLQASALMRLRGPVEFTLTRALRRLAARRPDVFERLGKFSRAAFVIAPQNFPVCFRIEPSGLRGSVRVVPEDARADVRISGAWTTLLRVFDGSHDADAAFFARDVLVEGDTDAAMALHYAVEAAELDLIQLARSVAPTLREALDHAAGLLGRAAGKVAAG